MKTLTRREARAEGYKAITMDITIDSEIYKSMQDSMKGVDAVWIETGDFSVQLARKLTTTAGKGPAK